MKQSRAPDPGHLQIADPKVMESLRVVRALYKMSESRRRELVRIAEDFADENHESD